MRVLRVLLMLGAISCVSEQEKKEARLACQAYSLAAPRLLSSSPDGAIMNAYTKALSTGDHYLRTPRNSPDYEAHQRAWSRHVDRMRSDWAFIPALLHGHCKEDMQALADLSRFTLQTLGKRPTVPPMTCPSASAIAETKPKNGEELGKAWERGFRGVRERMNAMYRETMTACGVLDEM